MDPTPSEYVEANQVQREHAKDIIEDYSKQIEWCKDGQDLLLDIGCGPGDVTVDFILPKMPKDTSKLVGVDKSKEMVDYAIKNYGSENVFFEQLDIAADIDMFLEAHPEGFNHVTSFYCLHWPQNQKKTFENIFKLLKPKGDCLLAFLVSSNIITIYKELSRMNKWKELMSNLEDNFAPYFFEKTPEKSISQLLKATGFKDFSLNIRENINPYVGIEEIKEGTTVINPFWKKMSQEEQDEYFNDYLDVASRIGVLERGGEKSEWKFMGLYRVAVMFARK